MAHSLILTDQDGHVGIVQEGESANITGQFMDGTTAIALASLGTVTLALFLKDSPYTTINSHTATDILNANDATIDANGNLVLRLKPLDNAIIGTVAVGDEEKHIARITWTWTDTALVVRTGEDDLEFSVRAKATPV